MKCVCGDCLGEFAEATVNSGIVVNHYGIVEHLELAIFLNVPQQYLGD